MHTNTQAHPEMHCCLHSRPQQPRKVYWGRVPSQSGNTFLLSPLKVSTTALGQRVGKLQEWAREGSPESFPLLSSCLDSGTFRIILLNQ